MDRRPDDPTPPSAGPAPRTAARGQSNKSLFRCLGEFVGHIAHAIGSDPTGGSPLPPAKGSPAGPSSRAGGAARHERVTETTEERAALDPQGRAVVLRRTVIEEIEYPAGPGPGDARHHDANG